MVGLVLVSHSQTLATGLLALIQQMAPNAAVALAAGTENPDAPIGTDPMRVYQAMEAVYSDDGVLVLVDLGSAIMSAEAALEFLEPQQQAQIYLCEAPLVEGALAAAVAAAGGASLARVMAEARAALPGKLAQLQPVLRLPPAPPTVVAPMRLPAVAHTITLAVPNRLGLHARPAARLVELVNRFEARVTLTKGAHTVDASSITSVITLGVRHGDRVEMGASGPAAVAVLAAIQALAAQNFGDRDDAATPLSPSQSPPAQSAATPFGGLPVAVGIALGPAVVLGQQLPVAERILIQDVASEQARLDQALIQTQAELATLAASLAERAGPDEAGILTAQRLMLADAALRSATTAQIATEGVTAAWAWQCQIERLLAAYAILADEYLRRRAADVRDVGNRVLRHLLSSQAALPPLPTPSILVADELTPSATATLDPTVVLGIVTATGGATGHAAIIARSLGIPAVTSAAAVRLIQSGQIIALDGSSGELWLDPDAATQALIAARRTRWLQQRDAAQTLAREPAITRDGRRIEVAANISSAAEVAAAVAAGAEGVGLFRTEFLFMGRTAAPDEETQFQAYRAAAVALGEQPLLIRTLDVGGDKALPYLDIPAEANPFLGWRGIRYCLDQPGLFRTQLRAILRAGYGHQVQVMFPMVSTAAEVQQARRLLQEEQQALGAAGIATAEHLAVGIMVETPAAVLNARQLAGVVDFFSIGTNDLTQYLMAADRGNSRVAALIDPLQPPVIAAMAQIAAAAQMAQIWVGVCGEIAGDPLVTPLLLGLGIDELSMNAPAIGAVKALIRRLDHAATVDFAHYLLTLPDAKAVRTALQRFADQASPS